MQRRFVRTDNMKNIHYVLAVAVIAVVAASAYLLATREIHEHADFAVFINGQQINFSQGKYMHNESAEQEGNETHGQEDEDKAHMHDNIGWLAHKHAADATWGIFFRNMNITFNSTCLVFDGSSYCSNATHKMRMFVNGKESFEYGTQKINDLDRVLFIYDTAGANISSYLAAMTDEACLYSRKCPERGEAGGENCNAGGKQCV